MSNTITKESVSGSGVASRNITKAAVIGSGVMGSGIAAHLANAGIPCLSLDIVPESLTAEEEKPDCRWIIRRYETGLRPKPLPLCPNQALLRCIAPILWAGSPGQYRGSSEPAEGRGLDH